MKLTLKTFLGLSQNGKIDLYYIPPYKSTQLQPVGNQPFHTQYTFYIHDLIDQLEFKVKKTENLLDIHSVKTVNGISRLDLQHIICFLLH